MPPDWRQTPPEASLQRQKTRRPRPRKHPEPEEPERGRLGLRRLCRRRLRQVSTPDVQEVGLASLLQQRQVCSQPLKLLLLIPDILLLVTLSIAVLRGVVFGAPLGLIVAATALLAFPLLPPLRTALLHLLGAVALEVPVLLALVALIGA